MNNKHLFNKSINLGQAKLRIDALTEENKKLAKDLKKIPDAKKNSFVVKSLVDQYKQNQDLISKLKKIEQMHLEAEIANLTADALEIAKIDIDNINKRMKSFNWDKYEKYMDEMQDNNERWQEIVNDNCEFDAYIYDEECNSCMDDIIANISSSNESELNKK